MIRRALPIAFLIVFGGAVFAQTAKPAQSPTPQPGPTTSFDLSAYGVKVQPDARLIIVMAALDAAGFDSTPAGRAPSPFQTVLRKDQVNLDADLRQRLKNFYERNRLSAPATPTDDATRAALEAARYVSLAYAMGQPPLLDGPERSEELPAGVLEVLDFAPLVREFYRKSGMEERLASYMRAYQAEGDRLRPLTAEMVRSVLSYLHTLPITVTTERVRVKSPDKKNKNVVAYSTREHERHFYIVPDLLAAAGTINFRVIADEYYAIVPEGTDPTSSELRRGFMQFVIDPLVLKFNKQVATQRDQIKQVIDARTKSGATVSPDVFIVTGKSLVAAADARYVEANRYELVTQIQRARLQQAKDDASRAAIAKEAESARAAIADESVAELADDYEKGAPLAFFFADQLRDFQSSGFDIANFFGDMITGIDPVKESKRLETISAARDRAIAARKAHPRYSMWLIDPSAEAREAVEGTRNTALIRSLAEIEKLLQTRHYEDAEKQLKSLMFEYPRDARLLFTLGRTASLWARDSTDDAQQADRLNRALANYRLAVAAASPDIDGALLSHAHESMGRILAFLERNDEAMKEFDAAIKIGPIDGGAYQDAVAGKKKLAQP